jgi:hypothetical protein
LQPKHFENILPSQKEHLNEPFLPVPLQKEQVKFDVPEPLHETQRFAGGPSPGAFPTCPVPLQEPHFPNIRPLQKEHLKDPFFPEPLQKEQTERVVPEPLHDPQGAACKAVGAHIQKPQRNARQRNSRGERILCIKNQ